MDVWFYASAGRFEDLNASFIGLLLLLEHLSAKELGYIINNIKLPVWAIFLINFSTLLRDI